MKNDEASIAFKEVIGLFDAGVFDGQPNETDMVQFVIDQTSPKKRLLVADYISRLLDEPHTNEQLQRIWFDAGPGLYFPNVGELRLMLQMLRDALSRAR